jgi:hypothetical protein
MQGQKPRSRDRGGVSGAGGVNNDSAITGALKSANAASAGQAGISAGGADVGFSGRKDPADDKDTAGDGYDNMIEEYGVNNLQNYIEQIYDSTTVSDEAALLVASAEGKGINVPVWLAEGAAQMNGGLVGIVEFISKFESLGLVTGVNEDFYTKQQLGLATSKESLRAIRKYCSVQQGNDVFINVPKFLQLCHDKFLDATGDYPHSDSSNESAAELYMNEAKEWADADIQRPKSAPSGLSGRIPLASNENDPDYINHIINLANNPSPDEYLELSGYRNRSSGKQTDRYADRSVEDVVLSVRRTTEDDDMINMDEDDVQEIQLPAEEESKSTKHNVPSNKMNLQPSYPVKVQRSVSAGNIATRGRSTSPSWKRTPSNSSSAEAVNNLRSTSELLVSARRGVAERLQRAPNPGVRSLSAEPAARQSIGSIDGRRGNTSLSRASYSSNIKRASLNANQQFVDDDADRILFLEEQVEELVRNCVRQTDMYHILQVHFGFIDSYMMVPARGQIVSSNKRTWISYKELQTAFANARLRLNDMQVFVFMKMVKQFATVSGSEVISSGQNISSGTQAVENDNQQQQTSSSNSHLLVIHQGKVSSEWLNRYLVYLRVTWKAYRQRQLDARHPPAQVSEDAGPEAADDRGKPVRPATEQSQQLTGSSYYQSWEDWVTNKKTTSHTNHNASKEFRKALAGMKHNLSPAKCNALLETLQIIPAPLLSRIVDNRVQCWKLDDSGRGDYQHQLNLEVKKLQFRLKKESRQEQGQSHQQQKPWNRCSKQQQREYILEITARLIEKRTKELFDSETKTCSLTKELFWEFQRACGLASSSLAPNVAPSVAQGPSNKGKQVWGTWLETYIKRSNERIQNLKSKDLEYRKAGNDRLHRNKEVAALIDVEKQLRDAADTMGHYHGMEIRKQLVALRRAALDRGEGHGMLVTKEDFDKCLSQALEPVHKKLPQALQRVTTGPPASNLGERENLTPSNVNEVPIFYDDTDKAAERVLEANAETERSAKQEVDEWTRKKLQLKQKQAADEV